MNELLLSSAHLLHGFEVYEDSELGREVSLTPPLRHLLHRINTNLEEVIKIRLFCAFESFRHSHCNRTDVSFLENVHVAAEVFNRDTACEDTAGAFLNTEVGEANTEHSVAERHGAEGVVDEEVRRHHFVDEELLD